MSPNMYIQTFVCVYEEETWSVVLINLDHETQYGQVHLHLQLLNSRINVYTYTVVHSVICSDGLKLKQTFRPRVMAHASNLGGWEAGGLHPVPSSPVTHAGHSLSFDLLSEFTKCYGLRGPLDPGWHDEARRGLGSRHMSVFPASATIPLST